MQPNSLTVQEAAANIVEYHDGLTEITDNIQDIRNRASDVVDDLSVVRRALDKVDGIRQQVSDFGDDIDKLQLVFKLMDKAGPLKGIAKIGTNMLKRVESTVDKVEAKIDAVAKKITDSEINQKLETAIAKVEQVDGKLAEGQSKVIGQRDSFQGVADIAAKAYVFAEEPILALGTVMDGPAAAVTQINSVYNEIVSVISTFDAEMPSGDFNALLDIETGMGRVANVLASIRAPLDVVYGALKPIEPVLNAVGLVSKFTVDPVIDFLLKTLRIDKVIEAASDKITGFLPNVAVLDQIEASIDTAVGKLDGIPFKDIGGIAVRQTYDDDGDEAVDADGQPLGENEANPETGALPTQRIDDPFGIGQWVIEEIEAQLIQTATEIRDDVTDEVLGYVRERIGSIDAKGLAVFVEIPEPLRGSDGDTVLSADVGGVPVENVILVGDDEANLITAFDGDNMLYGAGGDDTLVGEGNGSIGAGTDTAVFTGPLGQYVFSWADLDNAYSDLTIEHVSPLAGVSFDGTDLLVGLERVSFLGSTVQVDGEDQALTLTMQELRDFVVTSETDYTAPSGSDTDYYVFARYAQTSGQGISMTGAGGADLLVGGLASDTLMGGLGDDTLQGGGGANLVDGGLGRDLFSLTGGEARAVIDLQARTAQITGATPAGNSTAALFGIENVSADVSGRAYLYGDSALSGNALTAGAGDDGLHGRGGTDTLLGAEGDDTLVGGFDIDTLDGGAGDDHLVATDRALGWSPALDPDTGLPMGERIIGGDGYDRVYYTTILDGNGPDIGGRGPTYVGPFNAALWGSGDETDRQEMQQSIDSIGWIELRASMPAPGEASGVEVWRFSDRDANGQATVLAIDTLDGVEEVVGSNSDDILRGLSGQIALSGLFGAGGDDTIQAEEATGMVSGDQGRDLVIASARLIPQSSGDAAPATPDERIYVGDGFDTLDLSHVADVRWSLWLEEQPDNSYRNFVQASDARDSQSLENGASGSLYAVDEFAGFGTITLGRQDDVFDLTQIGDFLPGLEFDTDVRGGAGADKLAVYGGVSSRGPYWTLLGEEGDDTIEIIGDAIGDGGVGDDFLFGEAGQVTLFGGAGDDTISFRESFGSTADGGEGIDLLVLPDGEGDVYVDMKAGTADWGGSFVQISGFEAVAGLSGRDNLRGSDGNDKFSGNDGNDTLWGGDLTRVVNGFSYEREVARIGTYLRAAGDHETALSGSVTFETWISTVSDTEDFQRIITAPSGSSQQRLSLALKDGEAHLRGDMLGGGAVFLQSGFVADGAQHHLVGSYDAATQTLALWVDGVLQGSIAAVRGLRPADGDILVGATLEPFHQHIDAEIAQARIWSSVEAPDAPGGTPYIALDATGDRADILAPNAEVTQTGSYVGTVVVDGETTGQDALYGGAHSDSLNGGDDDDFLHPGGGANQFGFGPGQPDTVDGGRGRDTASFAFAGLDEAMRAALDKGTIGEAFEAVHVDLDAGLQWAYGTTDVRTELTSIENVIGTHLNDSIAGNGLGNVLTGGEGDDTILGRGGDDVIAALGADSISGGAGNDTIGVGLADATISGDAGDDVIVFSGNDTVEDVNGDAVQANIYSYDLLAGTYSGQVSEDSPIWAEVYGAGSSTQARSNGVDALTPLMVWRADPEQARSLADATRDVPDYDRDQDPEDGSLNPTDFRIAFETVQSAVSGALSGIEIVRGASGAGSNGADDLGGSVFDDTISGRGGDDTITGEAGNDTLTGGAGADLFVLTGGDGADVITDFQIGLDRFDVTGAELRYSDIVFRPGPDGLFLQMGDNSVHLEGVDAQRLTAADFAGLRNAQLVFETGALDLNHLQQTVTLSHSYENPVAFAFVASSNGPAPVNVRIASVSGAQMQLALQEPNNLDGTHSFETVTYMVVEAGSWVLEDGTLLEAGTLQSNLLSPQGFEPVTFERGFDTDPVVLSQVQSDAGPDFVVTRQDAVTGDGFALTMQEEQALNDGGHVIETLGWMAIEAGAGGSNGFDWLTGQSGGIGHVPVEVDLSALGSDAQALAQIASFNGTDPVWARGEGFGPNGLRVSAEEDTSADPETWHTGEDVAWFAFDGNGTAAAASFEVFMEIGRASMDHTATTLTLQQSYENPVVAAFVATQNGAQAVTVRVDAVDGDRLTLRLQEPNHLDGTHVLETVHYMVVEAGAYRLADGTRLEAGTADLGVLTSDGFETVTFESDFADRPAVISQVQTTNGADFVTTRKDAVSATGFDVSLQEEEARNAGSHAAETVGWIAMDQRSGGADGFDWIAGFTDDVTDEGSAFPFGGLGPDAVAMASLSSFDDPDPAWVRGTNNGYVFIEEDKSSDTETLHPAESVDWIAFSTVGLVSGYVTD